MTTLLEAAQSPLRELSEEELAVINGASTSETLDPSGDQCTWDYTYDTPSPRLDWCGD